MVKYLLGQAFFMLSTCQLRHINFMNNNKTESYQKLRALYQHKFFNENSNEQVLNTHNPIKFKKTLQSYYTHHLQMSSPSVPHSKKATGNKHKKITIQYQQIQTEAHSLPASWNQIIPQTSRSKPRSNKIFLNLKTLGFPFTSRETPSPISKLHPKKHSLMEMIEELRKLKQTETSNIELSQGKKDKVYEEYKCRHNTETLRCINKREKRVKMSASYNSSKPNTVKIEKTTHLMSNESKTNGIDPWNVSDNDFQSKKYF